MYDEGINSPQPVVQKSAPSRRRQYAKTRRDVRPTTGQLDIALSFIENVLRLVAACKISAHQNDACASGRMGTGFSAHWRP